MKIINIAQNSLEWEEYRKGKSGGSEFRDLFPKTLNKQDSLKILEESGYPIDDPNTGKSLKTATAATIAGMLSPKQRALAKLRGEPKKQYYEDIAEKVARPLTPNDYLDRLNGQPFTMMARGHILEPEAREAVSLKLGKTFLGESQVWEKDDNPNIYISPDGWIDGDPITEALEIKCLDSAETVKAFLTGKYPSEYYPQICKYFIVNENLETLYFALYTDLIPELELQIWTIKREDVKDSLEEMSAYEEAIMARMEQDVNRILSLGF